MYTPWFVGTEDTARCVLQAGEGDYLHFIELTHSAGPASQWHHKVLLTLADLLIASGTKIKETAASELRTSLQTR